MKKISLHMAALSVCLFCIALAGQVSAAQATPTETVQAAISEVLTILKEHQGADREQRWEAIGRVINAKFDFRSMSQSVLARSWRAATPEEKRQFVEYFSQYLEDTYRTKIEAYTDQKVEYISEQVRKDRAVVETEIVTAEARVPVTYRLKNSDGRWFAYDVVIEGVSLVNNYRNTFSAIIKAEGMDGLLTDLEGRIANYKSKHGGLPAKSTAAPKPTQ